MDERSLKATLGEKWFVAWRLLVAMLLIASLLAAGERPAMQNVDRQTLSGDRIGELLDGDDTSIGVMTFHQR
jgi:hypothetical protein